jgi:gamma-glutamyltranspeptidase/glutathione hydrolase
MVASSQPLASAAGLRILEAGGNAADAAVATAAALAVTEPCNTGLGGDCFALYYEADTARVTAMNSSGRAPAGLDLARIGADGFSNGIPILHPHAVTVPGAAAGWCECLAEHGTMPLSEVLSPAIQLAGAGFPVGPNTAFIWQIGARNQLSKSPGGQQGRNDWGEFQSAETKQSAYQKE